MPGGGPAEPAGDGDHVAGLRAGAGDGFVVAQVAQGGDGHGDRLAAHHVAADHGRAGDLAFVPDAVHQLGRPGGGEFGGDDEPEQDGGGHRAHRGDVREVLRGGLTADVVGGGPVAAEVPSFQQQVRAGHYAPVGGRHHRRVVPRPEPYRRGGGEPGSELSDEPEFPQLAHGALHPVAPSHSCSADRRAAQAARVSPRRAATRYRGVSFPHMILVAAQEVPWYRRTS